MATLADVRYALKQGNKQEAAKLLQQVLKERPSADAWFLAACLTQNEQKKVKYLQQALRFDSKHIESRQMLQSLTGKREFTARDQIVGEVESIVGESTLLQRLAPWMRLPAFLFVVIVAFAITQWAVGLLLRPPEPAFRPAETLLISPDALLDVFDESGIVLASEQVVPEGVAVVQWRLQIRPEGPGTVVVDGEVQEPDLEDAVPVDLFFYNSTAEMAADQVVLNERLADEYTLMTYHTVAMTYAPELMPPGERALINTFNSVPAFRDLLNATETAVYQATQDVFATATAESANATATMDAIIALTPQPTATPTLEGAELTPTAELTETAPPS